MDCLWIWVVVGVQATKISSHVKPMEPRRMTIPPTFLLVMVNITYWGFPKFGVPFFVVPIIRIIVFGDLY